MDRKIKKFSELLEVTQINHVEFELECECSSPNHTTGESHAIMFHYI